MREGKEGERQERERERLMMYSQTLYVLTHTFLSQRFHFSRHLENLEDVNTKVSLGND